MTKSAHSSRQQQQHPPQQQPRRWALPLLVDVDNKVPAGLALFTFGVALYLTSDHFPIFEPRQLGMTWIDEAMPFAPLTVWIYMSEYIYFPIVYVLCRDRVNLNKFFWSFLALQVASSVIFFLWPTTYPRDLFPLSSVAMDPVTECAFGALRQTDTPNNCCPSLHVSSVFLTAFLFLHEQRKLFPLFFLWGVAIAVSTMTTKQHYLVDVASGFALAAIAHWVFYRKVSYYDLPERLADAGGGAQANR